MEPEGLAVYSVMAAIVVLALATGPFVGLLSVPEGGFGSQGAPGSGTANVTVVSTPERATLEAGQYGDVYYLTVPESVVAVSNVTGAPYLTLSVDVDDIWISRTTIHSLTPGQSGDYRVSVGRASLEDIAPDTQTLPGRLRISIHDRRGTTVIADEPIEVGVTDP